MESYDKIKKVLALGFINFLDENKPKDKMCLSNGECADIEKAFNEKDWPRLAGYLGKYTESEDEKIRKRLVLLVEQFAQGLNKGPMLAYLEKQKEQKPVDDKAFEEWLDDWYQGSKEAGGDVVMSEAEFKNWSRGIRNMYQQKPAEWSEEDEKVYNNALDALFYKDLNNKDDVLSALKDLCDLISKKRKVIPPYSRWKPSDEQIKALGAAIVFHKNDPHINMWRSLYDDLQKIR